MDETRTRTRPWKVFVRDVGPIFSFGTEAPARRRAEALAREYAEVLVYDVSPTTPLTRSVYRFGREAPLEERFEDGTWIKVVVFPLEEARS